MQEISKKQMEFIKAHSPTTRFTVTNRQACKGRYKTRFVESTDIVKKLLKQFSEEVEIIVETYGEV